MMYYRTTLQALTASMNPKTTTAISLLPVRMKRSSLKSYPNLCSKCSRCL